MDDFRLPFTYATSVFDPDANIPRPNRSLIYFGACIIAGIRLARESQVHTRVLPTIKAVEESCELSLGNLQPHLPESPAEDEREQIRAVTVRQSGQVRGERTGYARATATAKVGKAMCGRYVRRSDKQRIAEWFQVQGDGANLPMPDADYNIAPTTHQPIIRQSRETGGREMVLARWGLVPFFTKDLQEVKGLSTINARAETITTAKTWREPMKKRRCLVPVNAFYEWPKTASATKEPKQPYVFELASGGLFAFAGLWDAWKDAQGHWLQSFAIVTTEANELMSSIHPRMPVILHPRDYDRWLDREETERLPIDLLRPFESEAMEITEANPNVGNVRNNGPEMMRKAIRAAEDGELPL